MELDFVDRLASIVPKPDGIVIKDGVRCCDRCGDAVEATVELYGEKITVPCICTCGQTQLRQKELDERRSEIEQNRRTCFQGTQMIKCNFENDDRANEKLSNAMRRYCDEFFSFFKQGKGLLLYGGTGTGKSYYAACIANEVISKGYSCLMTNFATIIGELSDKQKSQEYMASLERYSLLVIDDLGTESGSDYRKEIVFRVIDMRYRLKLPVIITTNLSMDEMGKTEDISYKRIYDRVLERCFPVKFEEMNHRRANIRQDYEITKNILGL